MTGQRSGCAARKGGESKPSPPWGCAAGQGRSCFSALTSRFPQRTQNFIKVSIKKRRCAKVHEMELIPSHWPEAHAGSLPQVAV